MKYILFFSIFFFNFLLLNCSFQIDLFATLNQEKKNENLVLSPLSVYQVLSLTSNGANGNTQQEIINTLGSTKTSLLNTQNYKLLEVTKNFVSVKTANAVMTKFTPLTPFRETAKLYDAPVEKLSSLAQVNEWCSEKTNGKITKILEQLNPLTMMLLLNAIYFKGEWKYPFDPENTAKKVFYNFNKKANAAKVTMMQRSTKRPYYEDKEIQAVELPFKNDSMSAIIILPNENIDINTYINSMKVNDALLKKLRDNFKTYEVNLELPKFDLDFNTSLKNSLQNMGINDAFGGKADFTGLIDDPLYDLYIFDVYHKTYLKVNEFGAEAAAVTVVDIRTRAFVPSAEMKVNRPFIMVIKSDDLPEGNDILFIAKIEEVK